MSRDRKIVIVIVVLILVWAALGQGFYLISHGINGIVLSMPDAFCVYDGHGDEYDLQEISVEHGQRTYHIEVDEECLTSPGSYVYVTGTYWGSLRKPVVHLNGENIKVKTSGTGYTGRYYHFYIRDVVQDHKYRIYVRCGEESDYINVVFHAR